MDAQARLLGVVVDAVHARQEAVARRAQLAEHVPHGGGIDHERRAVAEVDGVEDAAILPSSLASSSRPVASGILRGASSVPTAS